MIIFILVFNLVCTDYSPSRWSYEYKIYSSEKELRLNVELIKIRELPINTRYEFKAYKVDLKNLVISMIDLETP